MKRILMFIMLVFLVGCADHVGKVEFICPVCEEVSARIDDVFNDNDEILTDFQMICTNEACRTKSGRFESFEESTKRWPLAKFSVESEKAR